MDGPRRPSQRPRSRAHLLHVAATPRGRAQDRVTALLIAVAGWLAGGPASASGRPEPALHAAAWADIDGAAVAMLTESARAAAPDAVEAAARGALSSDASAPPAATATTTQRPTGDAATRPAVSGLPLAGAAAAPGATGISVPADAIASSLRVAGVQVRLTVHRGGTRLANGERVSRRGGVVDGDAEYTLTRAASPEKSSNTTDSGASIMQ